tara:strand:+ start:4320 stop:5489 length:1170 start_codon:yes stop_codon:yes gene_type:complete
MKIGLTTYSLPHKKTQDILRGLIDKNKYSITLFEMPFKKFKKRDPLIKHRPDMFHGKSAKDLCKEFNLEIIKFDETNKSILQEQDYIIIGGAQLIPDDLILKKKIINCHCGLTPQVRGLDSLKWAIYFNQPLGNTLHFVDFSIDDGEIIFQEKIDFSKEDSLDDLIDKMYQEEIKMLINFEAHLKNPFVLNLPRTKPNMRMPKKLEDHVLRDFDKYKLKFTSNYFIHETSIVDQDVVIGEGTRIWHWCHLSSGSQIGEDCTLGQNTYVGNNVSIGNKCKIQNNVSIYESVILEDEVFCGPSVVFTNVKNPRASVDRKDEFKKTTIRKGASIGANATIVCGVEIGAYSFIAAGAVVTKDTEPFSLVAGTPAQKIGWMSKNGERLDKPPNK